LLLPAVLLCLSAPAQGAELTLKSCGWYDLGRIMQSSDTIRPLPNYNGNWLESYGAHFTVFSDIGAHWEGAVGIGGFQIHTAQGSTQEVRQTKKKFIPLVTQARLSYLASKEEHNPFRLTFGYFPYLYNLDIRNLGAYLTRVPVYPGLLFSGFESKDIDPDLANTLGLWTRFRFSQFTWDVLIKSETDLPPWFDLSGITVVKYNLGGLLQLGAGANFYRFIALKKDLTDLNDYNPIWPGAVTHPNDWDYGYIDTLSVDSVSGTAVLDTVMFTHRGIKLNAFFSFDPKPLLGLESLGKSDLKVYTEAAIIGVADQVPVYTNLMERVPVVVGFNLPVFNLLDQLTIEVEWYGAKYKNDYQRLLDNVSPVPVNMGLSSYARDADSLGRWTEDSTVVLKDPFNVNNLTDDNWKWSIYARKTVATHIRFSLQIANDHFRPNRYADAGQRETAFSTFWDYYIKFRMGYLF
jgi:hypothetical protein